MAQKRKFQDITGEDFMYNGRYSDLTIRCRGRDFKVHKIFVCRASPVIEAIVAGNTAGAIEEEDFDVTTVGRWLRYIYTQTYDHAQFMFPRETPDTGVLINAKLIEHAKLYAIAEKYKTYNLMELAIEDFTAISRAEFQIDGFADLIAQVYGMTHEESELRQLVKGMTEDYIHDLLHSKEFTRVILQNPAVQELVAELLCERLHEKEQTMLLMTTLAAEHAEQQTRSTIRIENSNKTIQSLEGKIRTLKVDQERSTENIVALNAELLRLNDENDSQKLTLQTKDAEIHRLENLLSRSADEQNEAFDSMCPLGTQAMKLDVSRHALGSGKSDDASIQSMSPSVRVKMGAFMHRRDNAINDRILPNPVLPVSQSKWEGLERRRPKPKYRTDSQIQTSTCMPPPVYGFGKMPASPLC